MPTTTEHLVEITTTRHDGDDECHPFTSTRVDGNRYSLVRYLNDEGGSHATMWVHDVTKVEYEGGDSIKIRRANGETIRIQLFRSEVTS